MHDEPVLSRAHFPQANKRAYSPSSQPSMFSYAHGCMESCAWAQLIPEPIDSGCILKRVRPSAAWDNPEPLQFSKARSYSEMGLICTTGRYTREELCALRCAEKETRTVWHQYLNSCVPRLLLSTLDNSVTALFSVQRHLGQRDAQASSDMWTI